MKKVLILFAHPRYEQSRTNAMLVKSIPRNANITFHDLYELYPDFNIDVAAEKELLLQHDIVIWHHPFYWYNAPPLLKQWIDMVLEFGWAYGPGGTALTGKVIFNVITSGGPREAYRHDSRNRFTVREFLAPLEQTAVLCNMVYLPPFAVQGTHKLSLKHLENHAADYRELLERFTKNDISTVQLSRYEFLNDWLEEIKKATV